MPRFKHGTNRDSFGAAMRNSAASRQCPKCGRKSAIIRITGDENYESVRYCRWEDCDYERHGSNPASIPAASGVRPAPTKSGAALEGNDGETGAA